MSAASTFRCPSCGAPVEVRSARSKSIVCAHCRALVDLTTPAHAVLGTIADAPFVHPLRVGLSGTLRGVPCQVAGHIRYAQPDWHWDEYLLVANDGQTAWLEYDEGFTLYRPFVPQSFEPITASSRELVADGVASRIVERESAHIAHIAGELPFRARVGDSIEYVDAHTISVEITETELEWFRVSEITREEVGTCFRISPQELASRCYLLDDDGNVRQGVSDVTLATGLKGLLGIGLVVAVLLSCCFFFICLGVMTGPSTGTYPSGTGYDDGPRGGGHGSFGGYSGGK